MWYLALSISGVHRSAGAVFGINYLVGPDDPILVLLALLSAGRVAWMGWQSEVVRDEKVNSVYQGGMARPDTFVYYRRHCMK